MYIMYIGEGKLITWNITSKIVYDGFYKHYCAADFDQLGLEKIWIYIKPQKRSCVALTSWSDCRKFKAVKTKETHSTIGMFQNKKYPKMPVDLYQGIGKKQFFSHVKFNASIKWNIFVLLLFRHNCASTCSSSRKSLVKIL
jgi:hypothetical protein